MRRTLWQMTDNEVYKLQARSHGLLQELYGEYVVWLGLLNEAHENIAGTDPGSASRKSSERFAREAEMRVQVLEQKVAAQRTFCAAVDNEMLTRNPPFWTRQELEDIDANRDGIGKAGGGRGSGKRGGL